MRRWLFDRMAQTRGRRSPWRAPPARRSYRDAARSRGELGAGMLRAQRSAGRVRQHRGRVRRRVDRACSWPRCKPATSSCRSAARSRAHLRRVPRDRRRSSSGSSCSGDGARRSSRPAAPPRTRTTAGCATPAAAGLVLFSSGSTGKHKAAVHDLGAAAREVHRAAPLLPDAGLPAARSHRRHQHAVLHAGQRRRRGRVGRPDAAARVRGDRAAPRRAAADLADVPEPAAALGGVAAPRPVVAEAHHLRHRADAASPRCSRCTRRSRTCKLLQTYGLSELGILRSQSRELRFALGARRRRGLRDQGRRRPAVDPRARRRCSAT